MTVILTVDELIVLALLLGVAVPLYLQGSPFDAYEDQVLVAITRRLSELRRLASTTCTWRQASFTRIRFPARCTSWHSTARLGDIDPLFLYHKLRFFWGPAALVMLYLAARAVFGRSAVACAVTLSRRLCSCAAARSQWSPDFRHGGDSSCRTATCRTWR